MNRYFDNLVLSLELHHSSAVLYRRSRPKTDSIYYYIDIVMHTFWKKKRKKKKEQAQQPPSLHGRSDTPNSWKEKKKKSEPIYRVPP